MTFAAFPNRVGWQEIMVPIGAFYALITSVQAVVWLIQ